MSAYDNLISSLIAGDKIKLPLSVKDNSLRSAFHRTVKEVAQYGQIINKKLVITMSDNGQYKTAELVDPPVIQFEVLKEESADERSSS